MPQRVSPDPPKKRAVRCGKSIFGRAAGRGWLDSAKISAMISTLVLHALHAGRGAADQEGITIEALGVQGSIF